MWFEVGLLETITHFLNIFKWTKPYECLAGFIHTSSQNSNTKLFVILSHEVFSSKHCISTFVDKCTYCTRDYKEEVTYIDYSHKGSLTDPNDEALNKDLILALERLYRFGTRFDYSFPCPSKVQTMQAFRLMAAFSALPFEVFLKKQDKDNFIWACHVIERA